MGIFVRKFVKRKGYMLDAKYQISKIDNFSKTWYSLFNMVLITPAPLTPAFINATRKITPS